MTTAKQTALIPLMDALHRFCKQQQRNNDFIFLGKIYCAKMAAGFIHEHNVKMEEITLYLLTSEVAKWCVENHLANMDTMILVDEVYYHMLTQFGVWQNQNDEMCTEAEHRAKYAKESVYQMLNNGLPHVLPSIS